jgi:hypothetical protein
MRTGTHPAATKAGNDISFLREISVKPVNLPVFMQVRD